MTIVEHKENPPTNITRLEDHPLIKRASVLNRFGFGKNRRK